VGGFPAHAFNAPCCSQCDYSYRSYHRVGGKAAHPTIDG
jgi:hypothetical protein